MLKSRTKNVGQSTSYTKNERLLMSKATETSVSSIGKERNHISLFPLCYLVLYEKLDQE